MHEKHHVGSFTATRDDGTAVMVHIYQSFAVSRGAAGESIEAPGDREYKTTRGELVNRIAKGEYETLGGARLTSTDPNAP